MKNRVLIFDASALIFARSILDYVLNDFEIKISPLLKEESNISEGLTIVDLEKGDRDFVYKCLRVEFGKDYAIGYKKGRKRKNAGEFEALALAKRFDAPIVFHDKKVKRWAITRNIKHLYLVKFPEKISLIPKKELIEFYEKLCKNRSSEEACNKLAELRK